MNLIDISVKGKAKQKQQGSEEKWRLSHNELKYTFLAWLCYAVFLCPRIVLLFNNLAKTLDERDFLGPNFLKMAASFTPLVYFLLVMGSHSNKVYYILPQSSGEFDPDGDAELKKPPDPSENSIRRNFRKLCLWIRTKIMVRKHIKK